MADKFIKDPSEILDYQFDWSDWLDDGETIDTSDVTVDEGITLDSDTNSNTAVTAWLSGGVAGQNYKVLNTIVTSDDRTAQRTITIRVKNK